MWFRPLQTPRSHSTAPFAAVVLAAALALAHCAKGPSAVEDAADAALANISSQSLFSDINTLQATPALASVTAKLEQAGILADYRRILAQASNKPLKIDGVVFRNIKSRLAAQESYYTALDRRYGTIGNYLKSIKEAPGKITAASLGKSLLGIKSAFAGGANLTDGLGLDDQSACNAPKVWGCSNTGYALNAAGQVIPGQSGSSLALDSTGAWKKNSDGTYTQTGTQTSKVDGKPFTTDLATVPDLAAASYICDSVSRSAAASTGGCAGAGKAAQAGEVAAVNVFNASPVSQVGTNYNCDAAGSTCVNGVNINNLNTYNASGSPVPTNVH